MSICSIELIYTFILIMGSYHFGALPAYGSATLNIIKEEFGPLSNLMVGLFQAMPACVAIFGCPLYNAILKKTTRKRCTLLLGVTGILFWGLLLTMNKKYFWISIVIRALLGTVLAGSSVVPSVYISEIAPPQYKGFFLSLHIISIIMAHIITNLLGVTHQWRAPIYAGMLTSLILTVGVFFIPDSPYDINQRNDSNISNDKNEYELNDEFDISQSSYKQTHKKRSIFTKEYCWETTATISIFFIQQFSGNGAIMQNISPMMNEVGLTFEGGYQSAIALSAQLISTFVSSGLVDRFGCRKLYLTSTSLTAVCLLFYSLNVKFSWSHWLPMIILFFYEFFFGLGMSNIAWVIVPLMYPPELAPSAFSLGVSLNWTSATIVFFMFPFLHDWFGQFGLILILCGFNTINFILGAIFVKNSYSKAKDVQEGKNDDDIIEKLITNEETAIITPN